MKKKLLVLLVLICVLCMAFCSCDSDNEGGNDEEIQQGAEVNMDDLKGILEGPTLIISVGQSADISIAKSLLTKAEVEFASYDENPSLEGYKSIMLVPGVSVKGLGSAGISVEDELAATTELMTKLEALDAKVLVAHLGGGSRRDELTDQFIDVVLPVADCICALEEGNKDGKFTNFASSNNIPCAIAPDVVALVDMVATMYGK